MGKKLTELKLSNGLVLVCLFAFLIHSESKAQPSSFGTLSSADSSFTAYQYKKVGSSELDLTVIPSVNSQPKSPAIIFFFGGGWKAGSTKQFKPHADYFAQRGLTGILVDYRVSSRHGTTPFDAVKDARDAVKFVMEHADELGIDEKRVVLAGGSAGGHLALMSSFWAKENMQEPAALVLFNPVIDTGPEGYGYKRIGERYKMISPVDNIPTNPPPMIILLGTDDKIIDVKQAENFCSEVKRRHGHCRLTLYKDQWHGFFNYRHTENFIKTVREADRFLNQQQLLKGTPDVKEWMQNRDSITN